MLQGKTKRGTSLSLPFSLYVGGYICSTKGSSDTPFLDAATSRNTSNTCGTDDAELNKAKVVYSTGGFVSLSFAYVQTIVHLSYGKRTKKST